MGRGRSEVAAILLEKLFRVDGRSRLGGGQRRQAENERLQERTARSARRRS